MKVFTSSKTPTTTKSLSMLAIASGIDSGWPNVLQASDVPQNHVILKGKGDRRLLLKAQKKRKREVKALSPENQLCTVSDSVELCPGTPISKLCLFTVCTKWCLRRKSGHLINTLRLPVENTASQICSLSLPEKNKNWCGQKKLPLPLLLCIYLGFLHPLVFVNQVSGNKNVNSRICARCICFILLRWSCKELNRKLIIFFTCCSWTLIWICPRGPSSYFK